MATAHAARHNYADLPGDLVRRIFAQAGDHRDALLSVKDRCVAAWVQPLLARPPGLAPPGWRSQAAAAQRPSLRWDRTQAAGRGDVPGLAAGAAGPALPLPGPAPPQ